ncbi:MAG TPA: NPCBM/NEW2 domain-containing protein, partial [Tepidisphaeraceae bacterium]|nr:NPCBM/NEW2 domain-containing protein [Tepidisphaeraceae bacterium]
VTYAKGLGTNAISQIVYNLGGAYTNFLSDVGIDDEETTNGTVDFQVLADGVKIFDSGVMTPTSTTQSFNLNITGVKQLTLICGDAGDGPDYDHGDWAGARLIPSSTPVVPVAPSNLSASAISSSQINLAWADNSSNENSFKVQRSTDGTNFITIATLAANTTSYSDTGLSAATTYSYRVIASNGAGDSSPSNVSSTTTFTASSTVTYLSDLNWVSATNGWGPVEKDMSVGGQGAGDGHTITLNGVTYAKGLGTNAISQIVYNLGGAYTNFLCDVGIDDEETVNGTVDFQVLADGTKIFDSGVMTPTSATQSFNLNVTGVQQLTLICGDAGDGPDYDHGDWAGARLLSSAPAAAAATMALATPASTTTASPVVQTAPVPAIQVTSTKPTNKEIRAARFTAQKAARQARVAEARQARAAKKAQATLAKLLKKLARTNQA